MNFPKMGGGGGGNKGGGNFNAAVGAPDDKKSGGDGFLGKFDPDELERGAAALKEIDSSPHATRAFELGFMQEKSASLEHLKEMEKERSQRQAYENDLGTLQAEEARKTISHTADQERNTAQFKAEVEAQLQSKKLEQQRGTLEYQLKREQEQFIHHEQIRIRNEQDLEGVTRETLRLKGQHDREMAVAGAKDEAKFAAQQERENIEIRLRELRARKAEERRTSLMVIDEVFQGASTGAQALYDDRAKAVTLVAGLTALALGVYSARAATRVAGALLERHLGRPPLVRETSRWSWRPNITWLPWAKGQGGGIFDRIVLEQELAERLQWTTNALVSAQENGTPFRHLLLHGSPGTGKTLFARTLARQSGMDYAVMSGGDLGPLGREGPNELHKMFGWANRSKRGLVLFIDEADAFLRRGRGADGAMSEDNRNALSVFLHHTGTENARIAVILATNVPSVLDRAVLDRIDEAFEFPKPAYDQRLQMLQMFVDQYLRTPTKAKVLIEMEDAINDDYLAAIAKRTEGLSGRQLAKLVLAFQSAVFGSGTQRLTMGLAETVIQWRLANPNS